MRLQMKTFKDFLKEEEEFDQKINETVQLIKKDCAPYLAARGKTRLYRGLKNLDTKTTVFKDGENDNKLVLNIPVRKNRNAKDSAAWLHNALGNFTKEAYGKNYRTEAVFAAGSTDTASAYGQAFQIFPKGDFDYIWSPYILDALNLDSNLLFNHLIYWALSENEKEELFAWVKEVALDALTMSDDLREILSKSTNTYDARNRIEASGENHEVLLAEIKDDKFHTKYILPELLKRHGKKLYQHNANLDGAPRAAEIMIACDSYYAIHRTITDLVNSKL